MKYSILMKFLAVLLCALSLLAAVTSGILVVQMLDGGLYEHNLEALYTQHRDEALDTVARSIAGRYAAASFSNCPQDFIDRYYSGSELLLSDPELWFYTLTDAQGQVLENTYAQHSTKDITCHEFVIAPLYPVILDDRRPESPTPGILPEQLPEHRYTMDYGWVDEEGMHFYTLGICQGPAYLVTIHLLPGAYSADSSHEWDLLEQSYQHRYTLFIPLVAGVTLFALLTVYLCCAAGRRKKSRGIHPGGLNMLPMDLYAVLLFLSGTVLGSAARSLAPRCFTPLPNLGALGLMVLIGFGMCLIIVAFFFALAAQLKAKNAYLLRHSLIGTVCILLWKLLKALGRVLVKLYALLPMIWQWVLTGSAMVLAVALAVLTKNVWIIAGATALSLGILLYGASAYGKLMTSAREMSHGNLSAQVDKRALAGSFGDFADHLNALAGVAVAAGQNQARSERTKAELVTNVSHDIKTPLTSIINYVDLMKHAGSEEEASAYLEVLDRQSQRLKKLIEDLMELSKATSGNMPVEITRCNATETVIQALGEFSDKLEAAGLTTVFNPPKEDMYILADGRLTWRVLSNLLGNAVKYALPGSRVYVAMGRGDRFITVSVKNVSRDALRIDSEGLMERFVRGDTARNTEGSGLGLNIAASLMELQHGLLQLDVEGDLFNATLRFPAAE